MVMLNFKKDFVPAVEAGLAPGPWRPGMKRMTIRAPRSRDWRSGDVLQLQTGPRMKPRRIGTAVCAFAVRFDVISIGETPPQFVGRIVCPFAGTSEVPVGDERIAPAIWRWLELRGDGDGQTGIALAEADGFEDFGRFVSFFRDARARVEQDGAAPPWTLDLIAFVPTDDAGSRP